MNKFDVDKNPLGIGDIVVLCRYEESISREFEFWKVISDNKFTNHSVFIKGLTTGKTDCFSCDGLKKVNKKYKELVDKEIPNKPVIDLDEDGAPYLPRGVKFCPICGELVNREYNKNYCGNCRQKLDWEVEE